MGIFPNYPSFVTRVLSHWRYKDFTSLFTTPYNPPLPNNQLNHSLRVGVVTGLLVVAGWLLFRPYRAFNPAVCLHRAAPGAIVLSPFQGLMQKGLMQKAFCRFADNLSPLPIIHLYQIIG